MHAEAAPHSRAGVEGDASGDARSFQHRDRRGVAADPDSAVRLRAVARRQERADRGGDGAADGRGDGAGRGPSAVAVLSSRGCCAPCRRRSSCCSSSGRRHRAHSRRLLPARCRRRCAGAADRARRGCQSGADHRGLRAGGASASGRRSEAAQGRQGASRAGKRADAAVVQRGQRQQLLPGAGPDRAGHDADRRPADRHGDGARMGARHARGAAGHAGAQR